MGRLIQNIGGGGGVSSDEVTATRAHVLEGKTAVTSDSNDEVATGTMPNIPAVDTAKFVGIDSANNKAYAGMSYGAHITNESSGNPELAIDIEKKTVTPSASAQTVRPSANKLMHEVTVNAVSGLSAGNIKNGAVVGGVTGTYKGLGNAAAADVRKGKTFSTASLSNAAGTMAEKGAQTYTPGRSNQTIAASQYLTGAQTILGDADLTAGNIRTGANIFNVAGTYKGLGNAAQANVESGKTFSTASLSNASGSMAVMSGGSYTPSKSAQTISCSGKKMSSNITINAIPSNFVDLTSGGVVFSNGAWGPLSGSTFNMTDGYYRLINGELRINEAESLMNAPIGTAANGKKALHARMLDGSEYFAFRFARTINMSHFKGVRINYSCPSMPNRGVQVHVHCVTANKSDWEVDYYDIYGEEGSAFIRTYGEQSSSPKVNGHNFVSFRCAYNGAAAVDFYITDIIFEKR